MGRLLLIGEEADRQLQEYVHYLHVTGSAVNTAMVSTSAKEILLGIYANILKNIKLTKDWEKVWLSNGYCQTKS